MYMTMTTVHFSDKEVHAYRLSISDKVNYILL